MTPLFIEQTPKNPEVLLESGSLSITGRSYPEHAETFYAPVLEAVKKYLAENAVPVIIKIDLDFCNTGSSKCLLDIFKEFEKALQAGQRIEIAWYYEEDDEEMLELGEDYNRLLDIPVNLIAHDNE